MQEMDASNLKAFNLCQNTDKTGTDSPDAMVINSHICFLIWLCGIYSHPLLLTKK